MMNENIECLRIGGVIVCSCCADARYIHEGTISYIKSLECIINYCRYVTYIGYYNNLLQYIYIDS